MTEHEWDQLKDRELDNSLGVLFRSAGALAPLPEFTSRTLKAVRRAPLPAGRRALRHPLVAPISWTVLIAAAAGALAAVVAAHPAVATFVASVLVGAVRANLWVLHSVTVGFAWADLLRVIGRAVALGIATPQGSLGIMVIVATAALSLSALRRLLDLDSTRAQS